MTDWLKSNTDFLIQLCTLATILAGLYAWISRRATQLLTTVNEKFEKLEKVYESVRPNGGSSLYDKVVAIDRRTSEAEARSKILLRNLKVAEFKSDLAGNCIFINGAAVGLLNRPETDWHGKNWISLIAPENRESVDEEWNAAIRDQRIFSARFSWLHSNGSRVPSHVDATPYADSRGSVIGWIGIITLEQNNQ